MKVRFNFLSLLLSVIVIVFLLGKYMETATKDEYLFSMDTLKALKYTVLSQKSRGDITVIRNIEMIKRARLRLEMAAKIMEAWTEHPDEDMRKLSTEFIIEILKITDKFMKVENVFANSKRDWIQEYEVLIPATEPGYYRIFELVENVVSVMAEYNMYEDGSDGITFRLSVSQLASFLKFIDLNFYEELREVTSSKRLREMGMVNQAKISRATELVISLRDFVENHTPVPIKK